MKLKHGVIYSMSKKKNAEHGGFVDDDSHVGLLVSNPSLEGGISHRARDATDCD